MRAILIDPFTQTVSEVHDPKWDLKPLYALLQCKLVDIVTLTSMLILWVDDEGLLKPNNATFELGERRLAGRALITGTDPEDGALRDCGLTIKDVAERVTWSQLQTTGKLTAPITRGNVIHMGTPLFKGGSNEV